MKDQTATADTPAKELGPTQLLPRRIFGQACPAPAVDRISVSRAEARCVRQALSDARGVAALKRVDVSQVLPDGDLVALALVPLVPLVMVVKDQCDDVVEPVDEPVRRGRIDQAMEPAVEVGKVVVALIDHGEQRDVLLPQCRQLFPKR